ncbi:MAG: hypothetical protein M1822_005230 [Bathelium mastoideum]|nr:MAG: hypothetical protein M1822_005230 [Bathelium mastoideum]
MRDSTLYSARIASVVGATAIALACGTNYAYSAWGPSFAERLKLSATQQNIVGASANIGMYLTGIPVGFITDLRGPRPMIIFGALCLGSGYFPLRQAYINGPGSIPVGLMCVLAFLTGMGSCSAFTAAIKTAGVNWPSHRGTATAFPLSGFGLSAFFFTTLSDLAFPDDTGGYLLMLAIGTTVLVLVSLPFMRILPTSPYTAVSPDDEGDRRDSNQLHRPKSAPRIYTDQEVQSGRRDDDEMSSLLSSSSGPGDIAARQDLSKKQNLSSHHADITGLALFSQFKFWQLFLMMALLAGVGLMTINNIGNDARALWSHWDDSVSHNFIQERQLMHVSILSVASFSGRLLSGIGSDFVVKTLRSSRFWNLLVSSCIFTCAQVAALQIVNPHSLWLLSSLTGLAYGALFGVFPALVADAFGPSGLAFNWGAMTMAPVISANIFNIAYGSIYDEHSIDPGEKLGGKEVGKICGEGRECYRGAYWITLAASLVGVLVSLWSIRHESVKARREMKVESNRDA